MVLQCNMNGKILRGQLKHILVLELLGSVLRENREPESLLHLIIWILSNSNMTSCWPNFKSHSNWMHLMTLVLRQTNYRKHSTYNLEGDEIQRKSSMLLRMLKKAQSNDTIDDTYLTTIDHAIHTRCSRVSVTLTFMRYYHHFQQLN